MLTVTRPRVLAPFRDAWVEDASNATPSTLFARGSIEIASAEPASLLLDVSPMSGPDNGGTSLTVVLGGNQPAIGPHQWQLGLDGLTTLNCAPAVELSAGHLRCCCAPEAPANLSRVSLTLLRCTRGAAGCAPAVAPASFHYYRDPQIVRATPDRGQALRTAPHPTGTHLPRNSLPPSRRHVLSSVARQVSGGDFITVTARDWPDASVVGAAAPRCRFGSMHAVPATVTAAGDSRADRRGEVKLVCTSPNFHRAQHHAAGSELGGKSRHRGPTYDGRHTQPATHGRPTGLQEPASAGAPRAHRLHT
eukprot:scaffold65149_cov45-Phaeocystis_antarctica.AAC.1